MLRFTIFMLVYFLASVTGTLSLGNEINIAEGNDLYLSLPNVTSLNDTCRLYGPNDEQVEESKVELFDRDSCGYIVRNVNRTYSGTWAILYGDVYRKSVVVNVLEPVNITLDNLSWDVGSSVDTIVGVEDAVYCRIRDNRFQTLYEGFGPCRIVVDRVTMDHDGQWSVNIAVPGARPAVTTTVRRNGQSVLLTCSVPAEYEVSACMFRDPRFTNVIATHGVGQGGYAGGITSFESDAETHVCTLRILKTATWQERTWRCSVNTSQGVLHGFLNVTSASMPDYEPELRSSNEFAYEGDAVTMSCYLNAAIRYCYFRDSNGTVYNVGPSISSPDYEYVGSGFTGGECGIRFNNILPSHGGSWTCSVGLENDIYAEEKTSYFTLTLSERVWTQQFWKHNMIVVQMGTADGYELDYCRFVRIDGLGFTSDNVPEGYRVDRYLMSKGQCVLHVELPTTLDDQPWTLAAKFASYSGELFRTTYPENFASSIVSHPVAVIFMWVFFVMLFLMIIVSALLLISKAKREWTYARAYAHIRDSFRRQPSPPKHSLAVQPAYIITDLPSKA